jgi:RNA polymerase sigma factor (TIGR02999 family)
VNHAQSEVSLLIHQVKQGDDSAREKLFFLLHAELRDLAGLLMRRERPDHTLQATALVNEACIRLLRSDALMTASDRKYLFAAANRAMRQVLIDHSRRKRAPKRGGDYQKTSLDVVLENFESSNQCRFEDLEAALEKLEIDSKRQREVVELKFFSGLSLPEVAEVLEVSLGTVQRDWRLARAKLIQLLDRNDAV